MPIELFANNPTTALSGALSSGDLTLTVTSSTGFPVPTVGVSQFRILVEAEIMVVTEVSGTTWTVTRGAEDSVAAAHGSGAPVIHIVTAGSLGELAQFGEAMIVVAHGTDPNVARPPGASAVYWKGSVEPVNAADDDLWVAP